MADARGEVGFVISRGNLALGISLEKNGRASMRHPPLPPPLSVRMPFNSECRDNAWIERLA